MGPEIWHNDLFETHKVGPRALKHQLQLSLTLLRALNKKKALYDMYHDNPIYC